jgi:hypothetical protein
MLRKIFGIPLAGLGLGIALATLACEGEDDDVVACYYEERSSACGGGDYGEWEMRCIEIENDEPCSEIVKSDTVCESTCCVSYQVRELDEVRGDTCPL